MPKNKACLLIKDKEDLTNTLRTLLKDKDQQKYLSQNALHYVADKQAAGMDSIMNVIKPSCVQAGIL